MNQKQNSLVSGTTNFPARTRYFSVRRTLAMSLMIIGVGVGLFGPAFFQGRLPVAHAACSGSNLYLGSYYRLPDDGSHPDFEQPLSLLADIPGQFQPNLVSGLPVPTSPNPPTAAPTTSIRQFDWYTPDYQAFTRLDNNPLSYSNDATPGTVPYFGPGTAPAASAALPATQDLFAVHWHANLYAPPGGLTIPYAFALDDAGWVFLDGVLQIDHGGIHPPATFTGNFVIPAGVHSIDIFYADRHTVNAVTNFQLGNLGALLDCGSPNLSLVKSVNPSTIVNPGDIMTYTIQVSNSGNYTATNTIIRDTTPANTSFVAASPAPVSGPAVGGSGELVWNAGQLLPGQTRTLTLQVRVNPNTPPAVAIANAALGTSNESGGVVFRSNGVSNLVNAAATLALNKTASPPAGSSVSIGDNIDYTLTVNNFGNVATGSVVVQDPLPPGTSYVSASPTPQSVVGNLVRWVIPPLPPNGSATLNLRVKVINRPTSGLLQNQANASSNGVTTGSSLVSHNVSNAADTSAVKYVQNVSPPLPPPPAPVPVGTLITYRLEGYNAGPSVAVGVVMTDTLPTGVTLIASVPPTTTLVGTLATWQLGDLAAGVSSSISYTVRVDSSALSFSNRAGIRSGTPEIQPGNNTSEADVPGNTAPVDAQVIKTGPPTIASNQVFIYTLRVSSVMGGDNVIVTDTLAAGLTLVPEQTSPPPFVSGATLRWNMGHFEPGDSKLISLAVRASGVTPGTPVANTAQVEFGRGPTRITAPGNTVNSQVANSSNLTVSKATLSSDFSPGLPVSYRITVTNQSAMSASGGFTMTDTLLPGLVFGSATPPITTSRVNPDGSTTLFWRIASVPAASSQIINLTVQVPLGYSGPTVSNSAGLETDTPNANPNLTTDPVLIPQVGLLANLVLSKDSAVTSLKRGQAYVYTLAVRNTGPIEAKDVMVRDPLPPGLTYISAQPAPVSLSPLTWNVGNLPAGGGTASIVLIVKLDTDFKGNAVSNSTNVSSLTGNSNQPNNTVVKIIPINAPPASATPAFSPRPGGGSADSTPTPTRTLAATPALTVTLTPGPTLTAIATTTIAPATTAATELSPGPTPLPGLPNTGQVEASANYEWLVSLFYLVVGLGLIGVGIWLWRPRRRT